MAPIRIKHVVSFTSEDPRCCVENLCVAAGDGAPWLCSARDRSGVLKAELQLERATAIHYIDVGNFGSAFIQVDVGRSSWPLDHPYVTLLPTATLMCPTDSRQGTGRHGVRMFKKADLLSQVAKENWDRVRVTCSQPFNKRIQFGLSFLRLRSAEESTEETSAHEQENQKTPERMQSVKEWLFSPAVHQTVFGQKSGEGSPDEAQRNRGSLSRAELMVMAAQSRRRSLNIAPHNGLPSSPPQKEAQTDNTQLETRSDAFISPGSEALRECKRKPKKRQEQSSTESTPKRSRSAACETPKRSSSTKPRNTDKNRKTPLNLSTVKTHIPTMSPRRNNSDSPAPPETICPICGVCFSPDYLPLHASSCLDSSSDRFSGVMETEDVTSSPSSPHFGTSRDELMVACPLCSFRFPADCIQQHASTCGDPVWLD